MEQIGGITRFEVTKDQLIFELPKHSWLQNSVQYYAIPRRKSGFKEIIIAPFFPNDWGHIWELQFKIQIDRQGIVAKITEVLTKLSLNIVKQEGITPSEEVDYSFWALVKINDYSESRNLNLNEYKDISIRLKEDLQNSLLGTDIEVVQVKTVDKLFENDHSNLSPDDQYEFDKFYHSPVAFEVKDFVCKIPISSLFISLGKPYNNNSYIYGTIFSDFSQKNFYTLRFFEEGQYIIYLDIRHKHIRGAISEISKIIYQFSFGKFNIMYNRVLVKRDPPKDINSIHNASHWYVLIDLKLDELDKNFNCNTVFETIEKSDACFGEGNESIRVIDYTDNLHEKLSPKYRSKLIERRSRQKSFEEFIKWSTITACIIGFFCLLTNVVYLIIYGEKALEILRINLISNSAIGLVIALVLYKRIREAIVYFWTDLTK